MVLEGLPDRTQKRRDGGLHTKQMPTATTRGPCNLDEAPSSLVAVSDRPILDDGTIAVAGRRMQRPMTSTSDN